jgi:hypothetical protein
MIAQAFDRKVADGRLGSDTRPGQGQGFNPLAFAIAIVRSISAKDGLFSDVWRDDFFSFVELLFGEVFSVPENVRNIDNRVGFHFAVAIISNAQNQLHYHVRTENDCFRYGREPWPVAGDSAALSLYPLP